MHGIFSPLVPPATDSRRWRRLELLDVEASELVDVFTLNNFQSPLLSSARDVSGWRKLGVFMSELEGIVGPAITTVRSSSF